MHRIFATALVAALFAGCGTSDDTTTDNTGGQSAPATPHVLNIGDVATVPGENHSGTGTVTITKADWSPNLPDAEGNPAPADNGLYLVLIVELRNTGDVAWAEPAQFSVQGPDGTVFDPGDYGRLILTAPDPGGVPQLDSGFEQLQPGQRKVGSVVFDLPAAARGGLALYEGDDSGSIEMPPARIVYAQWRLP